jgi:SAM-dependent methyltransferase
LVPLNAYWTTEDQYLKECRVAAESRGVEIQRVFILPNHAALFSASLRDHVEQDERAGILTSTAFLDTIPETDAVQDFGLWDEELLCLIEAKTGSGGQTMVTGCTFTRETSSLEKARLWRDSICLVSQPAPALLKAIDALDEETELLVRSADDMRGYAREYCHGSYLTTGESSCEWYHGSWQYLRMLGLVSTPDWHAGFYARSFQEVTSGELRDVLVSGTADYAMLHHLAKAIPRDQLQRVIITILDACPTPLQVCRWYARHFENEFGLHLNLRYNQRDALETGYQDEAFDMITSDAFVTRLQDADQKRLVAEWHRILKPGGRIVTTIRLSRGTEVRRISATHDEIEDFVTKVRTHIQYNKPWLRPMMKTIIDLCRGYAGNIVSYPVPSEDYVGNLFQQFEELSIECGLTLGEFEGSTEYARVVAVK